MGPKYRLLHQLCFSSAPLRNGNIAALQQVGLSDGAGFPLRLSGAEGCQLWGAGLLLLMGLGDHTSG